jgi:ketosteroid isomerase-like protein
MAHPNEDLLRRGYEAFGAGDIETVMALFAEDIVWHSPGANQLTGDYHGRDQVLGYLGKIMELTGGTFRVEIHDLLANDRHGTVLVTTHAERGGRTLTSREINIWHLANGKYTEFWTFAENQADVDNFLA